jgi:hypothetical protein
MAQTAFPWGGDVSQVFEFWRSFFSPSGGQFGLLNLNVGRTSDPAAEREIVEDVASYGRQLGRIGDALQVLLDHFEAKRELTEKERDAIDSLRCLLREVRKVKRRRGLPD